MSSLITIEGSNEISNVLNQYIYIANEEDFTFIVKNVESSDLISKLDKSLLILSILVQSGYISSNSYQFDYSQTDNYESTFHFYLNQKNNYRNHDVFDSKFVRSQSGQWSYIVK